MPSRKALLLSASLLVALLALLWRTGAIPTPAFLGGETSAVVSASDPDATASEEDDDETSAGLSLAPPSARRIGPADAAPAAHSAGDGDPAALVALAGEILRADGRVASGARVVATDVDGRPFAATADAAGRFRIDLAKGRYDLAIRGEGGALFLRSFPVDGRPLTAPLRLGAAGEIRVEVGRAGVAVGEVPVRARLRHDGAFTTIAEGKTDAGGVAVLQALPVGPYVVEADAAPGVVASKALELAGNATAEFDLPLLVRVSGTVSDAETRLPVAADVEITVSGRQGATMRAAGKASADGAFDFEMPIGDVQQVLAVSPDYAPFPDGGKERGTALDAFRSVKLGQPATLAIALHRGTTVRGRVVLAGSTDPAPNLGIRFTSGRAVARSAVTGADGTYEAKGLGRGTYNVLVETPGWYVKGDVAVRVNPRAGEAAGLVVAQDLAVESAGALTGLVVSPDGAPVPGARVWVSEGGRVVRGARRAGRDLETVSDGIGAFAIDDVPLAAAIRVRASLGDAEAIPSAAIRLADGAAAPLRLVLGPTGRVEGRVTDVATREPLVGARVDASPVGQPEGRAGRNVTTIADGRFEIAGLIPGLWRLVPSRPRDYLPGTYVEVDVPAGAAAPPQALALDPGLAVGGTVVDAAGNAVSGARLALSGTEEGGTPPPVRVSKNGTSDARGAFRWQGLKSGDYALVVTKGGYVAARIERLRGGEERLRVVLSPASPSSGGSR